jgi:hypothetical protein
MKGVTAFISVLCGCGMQCPRSDKTAHIVEGVSTTEQTHDAGRTLKTALAHRTTIRSVAEHSN